MNIKKINKVKVGDKIVVSVKGDYDDEGFRDVSYVRYDVIETGDGYVVGEDKYGEQTKIYGRKIGPSSYVHVDE
jgi:hypothetical protein